ncbi:hypothetical protein EDI_271870 [Entamoeba dispar SAW760]|uniref:Uncharacterized protein n=1 Tax=Entamoeba dispar (strain ATCC PRA-260 / SAW760) TaxID=370354 RepID=B0EFP0_ENTDS|nr:uncharacterized protein EDI_271870 [Entamoeba dispar SAW760]EDR26671.1 hypothetical protein EDI_271870 [Entamoeba dispar SAW760]|eukprot:EDR26671.1 hypothetical protein EDI_271870 [Entamoeba dispar SAW760]
MNNLENLVQEYYTTSDNNRRIQLKAYLIEKIKNKEEIEILKGLLQSSNNAFVQTYCISLLSQGMLESPELFIGISESIQLLSLQLFKNNPQMKKSASTLFASSVIGCWQFEHNTQNLVNTFQVLSDKNYDVFVDMSNILIDTFRTYQTKPSFPKKITADFRNSILMVITGLAGSNLNRPGIGAISILENAMFVCNITKTDETDETFTFYPTKEFLDYFMSILDIIISRVPESLNLIDQLARIKPSCFVDTMEIEGSRDWFVKRLVKVVDYCATSGRIELINMGSQLLTDLHATHPIFSYINQEFIDHISAFTTFACYNGDSRSIYNILRFWGMYSLYPSFIPSSFECVVVLFCRLIQDEYEEINESAFLHFGVLAKLCLAETFSIFETFINLFIENQRVNQTDSVLLQRIFKTIEDSKTNEEIYFNIFSNLIILSSSILAGRDPTDSQSVCLYSMFARKIDLVCKGCISNINSSSFDRSIETPRSKVQMAILMFYKSYISSYLWDESKNYRDDGMIIIRQESITSAFGYYLSLIEMIFTLISMWCRNYKVLMKITEVLKKIVSINEYANKVVKLPPLKFLFEDDCFSVLQNVSLPLNEMVDFRTSFYQCLGLLLYNIPLSYHVRFLRQFLIPHPFQLVDIRAIVKASHSCIENIPPIFEHICAHNDIYLHPINGPINGDDWFFVLRLAKQITVSRDFKYNYAPECPTACRLFHYIAELVIKFSEYALEQQTQILATPKGELFDNFIRNASLAIKVTVWLLDNNHINFAAFKIYNDNTVTMLINAIASLSIMIENYSLNYPKTFEILLKYCEKMAEQVVSLQLESEKVQFIFRFACRALKEKKVLWIVTGSSSIESILYSAYNQRSTNEYCVVLLKALQGLIPDIIMNAFDNLFNEFEAWTLERLIFAIIVIYPDIYQKTQFRIASFIQNSVKRQKFMSYFQMIDLGGTMELDDRKMSSFDERLKEFIKAIKPLYHNNGYE